MLLADRGNDADWIGELARQQGAWANIPPKRNRKRASFCVISTPTIVSEVSMAVQ
jgi:hypothetical protein